MCGNLSSCHTERSEVSHDINKIEIFRAYALNMTKNNRNTSVASLNQYDKWILDCHAFFTR
ncbi:hypothetical protein [Helicobacter sp. T3_23-1059]